MNPQIRKLFSVILGLFVVLGVAVTYIQFFQAPSLVADGRNARRYIQASERDRGPIIIADTPVAVSDRVDGSNTYQRLYPNGPLYAPVTGYFSATNLNATGMEAAENSVLEGETSELFWHRIQNLIAGQPRQGGGVALTIDPVLQQIAAEELGERAGAVVALDTETGAVRALYSSPTYDPNPLASLDSEVAAAAAEELEADPSRPLDNRAIASTRYAPGSIFKILTSIAMLESGYTPTTKVEAPVTTTLPGTETSISNSYMQACGDGQPTLTEAFARSCNTPFIIASTELKPNKLEEVTDRFGFGEKLSIPLPVTPSSFPEDTDAAQLAMSSIGQFEVQTTPMQMAMVVQAIANNGVMMKPYLVDSIVDADNRQVSKPSPRELGVPVTATVADQMKQMMISAVNEPYGSAVATALPGIQVAGKTGTAEIGDGTRTNAWIVAFAPAEDPKLAVAVLVESSDTDPMPGGGITAGPIAKRLLEAGLQ